MVQPGGSGAVVGRSLLKAFLISRTSSQTVLEQLSLVSIRSCTAFPFLHRASRLLK